MKNEKTIIEYETTTLGKNTTTPTERTTITTTAQPQNSSTAGKATAGLVAGVLLGSASAWAANHYSKDGNDYIEPQVQEEVQEEVVEEQIDIINSEKPENPSVYIEEPTTTPEPTPEPEYYAPGWAADNLLGIATTVTDDMSFSQAFAAARAEVGAGGAFEWRGDVYSTYYAEEWNNMTSEEIAEYNSHFHWANNASEPVEVPFDEPIESYYDIDYAENYNVVESEPEVEFLGVEQLEVNVGGAIIDNQEIVFIDIDNDEVFDLAIADLDGNSELSADEIVDVSEDNISVNDFILAAEMSENDELDYCSNVDYNEI